MKTKNCRQLVAVGLMLLVGSYGVLARATAQSTRVSVRERIAGAWHLESRTVTRATGASLVDPVLGQQPPGRLFYDASGHMMLQMMRQGRAQAISVPSNPSDAKNPRIVLGYDAYFGTFTVNEAEGTITHHVEGSLFPEDLGKDFKRFYKLDGDTFTLSFTSKSPDGPELTRTLRFRRAK